MSDPVDPLDASNPVDPFAGLPDGIPDGIPDDLVIPEGVAGDSPENPLLEPMPLVDLGVGIGAGGAETTENANVKKASIPTFVPAFVPTSVPSTLTSTLTPSLPPSPSPSPSPGPSPSPPLDPSSPLIVTSASPTLITDPAAVSIWSDIYGVSKTGSWTMGHNNVRPTTDVNAKMAALEGELSDEEAKATLAEFLFHNPRFMMDLIGGIKMYPMQELIMRGWARNDYNLMVAGRGIGKTLAYNQSSQLLSRDHGLIALPDLIPNVNFSQEGWTDIPETWLWNGEGWQRTDKIYVQPQKNCLRIITRDGYRLEGSTNHLIQIWNYRKRQPEWKKYDEIKPGELVCLSRTPAHWGEEVSEKEQESAFLVGMLLAGRMSEAYAAPLMEKWGIPHPLPASRLIPACILKNRSLLRQCLRGLIDADQRMEKGHISFHASSGDLAHQVQCALLAFGVVSKRVASQGRETIYIGSGIDLQIFAREFDASGIKLRRGGTKTDDPHYTDTYFFSAVTQIEPFVHDCLDFNVPTGERYWSNGFISHNSFMVAIFSLYWAIFNPNARIVIASYSFRQSRAILDLCIKLINDESASLLRSCFPTDTRRGTDEWKLEVPNGAVIRCLPLGDGKKIRGVRADLLTIDEFAFLPEPIIGEILRPFLASNSRIKEQRAIEERENEAIARGLMREDERTILEDNKKVIFLSSACWTFEHLYKRYQDWTGLLTLNPSTQKDKYHEFKKAKRGYFIARIGWEAAPKGLLNVDEVLTAKSESSEAMFNREYGALFTSDSDGYFRASKMQACSIPDGESPCLELAGDPNAEYVLGLDQSLSGSEGSDHFAMCLMKIVTRATDGRKLGMVVHSYAVAGGNLQDHATYLYYLLSRFNVVYIALDASQGDEVEFVNSCNQSARFQERGIRLLPIEADFHRDDFRDLPTQIKRSYNRTEGRIVQKQSFHPGFQRAANEYLQACFDHRNILFAGKIAANSAASTAAMSADLSLIQTHEEFADMSLSEFMSHQDFLIDLTRKECAMIQVKATDLGTLSFGLPQNLKRTTGANKVRKDSYSALLIANWAVKMYVDAMAIEVKTGIPDFPYALVG